MFEQCGQTTTIRRSMGILLAHLEPAAQVNLINPSNEINAYQNAQDQVYMLGMQCILKRRFDLDFIFGVMCALGCAPIAICDIRQFFSEAEPWQNLF